MFPQISQAATYDNKGWEGGCVWGEGYCEKYDFNQMIIFCVLWIIVLLVVVVGFITTYRCEFESHSGELYSIQHVKVCQ
jgi:hypothetical protein